MMNDSKSALEDTEREIETQKLSQPLPTLDKVGSYTSYQLLAGQSGFNRAPITDCQIKALHDAEAISCWLSEYREQENTHKAYQKEAERFLLWCLLQGKKAISDITREDLERYWDFLSNPTPKEQWCGLPRGKKTRRGSSEWRPFVGPLSESARRTTFSILDSLFRYWVDAGYWRHNPLQLMRRKRTTQLGKEERKLQVQERILESDEWAALLHALESLPDIDHHDQDEKERLRFLIAMLYFLGLRIGELASHTWGSFREVQGHWWFFVRGKGNKIGKVPVNDTLLGIAARYRIRWGLSSQPTPEETRPLISSWNNGGQALSVRHLNFLLKRLALRAADQFKERPDKAQKLKQFSAHWLRHLSATMQDRSGIAFKHIKANHRHEKEETTRIYVHADDAERHADMQRLDWMLSELMNEKI